MNGYRRELATSRDLETNQGITETALDDTIYRVRFSPTVMTPSAGAALFAVGPLMAMQYPDAATAAARANYVVPTQMWIKGTITIRLIYGGDTSSTNPIVWGTNFVVATSGSSLLAASGVAVQALPGPATARTPLVGTLTRNLPVDASTLVLGINIYRDGLAAGDTYAGIAELYGWELIYTPAGGH